MHCVNKIKCRGWIDYVTFLYHPVLLFPLMLISVCEIHTLGNKVHYMIIHFLFTAVKES